MLLSLPVGVHITHSVIARAQLDSSAKGVQIGRRNGRRSRRGRASIKAERAKPPLGRGQTRCAPSGKALGPEVDPGQRPKAVEGAERAVDGRPEKKATKEPCRTQNCGQQQVARRRRQRQFFAVSE